MFTLTLVTPEKKIVAGQEIEEIFVPAYRGQLQILPGHANLMTTLQPGILKYRLKGQDKLNVVAISWGYCEVNPTGVNALAESAERPEELDVARIQVDLEEAERQLKDPAANAAAIEKYSLKVARARARQDVAKLANT